MVLYRIPILIALMIIVYIYIVPQEPFGIRLIFKLIPLVMIIYYALMRTPAKKQTMHYLVLTGLFVSMIGDATIHWFVVGLGAFFIAHVLYTAGFVTQLHFSWVRGLIVVPLSYYAFWFARKILPVLKEGGDHSLSIPVIAYIIVISIMALAAFLTGNIWAMLGSLLFIISDSILAWNMFISPVDYPHAWIMLTYYGAQFCIAHALYNLDRTRQRLIW